MKTEIHQIYYDTSQLTSLDKAFIPFNNQGKVYPYNFEYAVFFELYKNVNWSEVKLLGTTSWKFHKKTGLNGENVLKAINENPEMDIYFINPFPELSIYENVWVHGEEFHPNLTHLASKLLSACGYSDSILFTETPPNLTAYCNYWVANKTFWDKYISFLKPIWEHVISGDSQINHLLAKDADPFIKAPYLPFIFERLFSTFLALNNFRVCSIPIAIDKLENNHYLAPVKNRVMRVSSLSSHKEISCPDKFLISSFNKVNKYRHYYAPLVLKKILGK